MSAHSIRSMLVTLLLGTGAAGCVVSSYRPSPLVRGATVRLHLRGSMVVSRVTGTLLQLTPDSVVMAPTGVFHRQGYARASLTGLDVWTEASAPVGAVVVGGLVGAVLGGLAGYASGEVGGIVSVEGSAAVGAVLGGLAGMAAGVSSAVRTGVGRWRPVPLDRLDAGLQR